MFTYLIYIRWLSTPDSFWQTEHLAALWALGVGLDLMLLLVLWTAVLSAATLARGTRRWGAAGLVRLSRVLTRTDRLVQLLAGAALAAMVGVVFLSVLGRAVWKPIPDDYTFAEWAMVLTVALMLGGIQGRGEHIEVTALAERMSLRANRALRLVFMLGIAWWLARIAAQALILPVTQIVPAQGAAAPPDWDLTPLLPPPGHGEVESSAEFLDLTAAGTEGGARHGA
ncbi:MAG: TRAP transporter small permease [Pseudodonghicola sp.]